MSEFLRVFNPWVDSTFGTASDSGGVEGDGPGKSSAPSSRKKAGKSSGGQKRGLDDEGQDAPQDNGDGNGEERNGNKRAKREDPEKLRFACPFFKHNPQKYKQVKTCCGPGWDTVHRLK